MGVENSSFTDLRALVGRVGSLRGDLAGRLECELDVRAWRWFSGGGDYMC